MTLLSMTKYAAQHGVTKQAASKWKARGLLVLKDGKVDVERSNEKLKRHLRDGLPSVNQVDETVNQLTPIEAQPGEGAADAAERILGTAGAQWDLEEARRVKENYLALLNQLEYDQKAGTVVLVADVTKLVGEEYAKVRTRLLAIPSNIAPRLLRIRTAAEMQAAVQEAIHEAMEELTRDTA